MIYGYYKKALFASYLWYGSFQSTEIRWLIGKSITIQKSKQVLEANKFGRNFDLTYTSYNNCTVLTLNEWNKHIRFFL